MYFLFGCRGAKRFYFFILSTRFTDHYHTCRAGTIVFLAYIHGAKVHVFRLRHPNHPIILRNSLIIIVRYMMAQKSDEVRRMAAYLFMYPSLSSLLQRSNAGVGERCALSANSLVVSLAFFCRALNISRSLLSNSSLLFISLFKCLFAVAPCCRIFFRIGCHLRVLSGVFSL